MLTLACFACFTVRGRGTPAPFDAPRVFVAVGPYRYVRNPMYIGGIMLLAGLAMLRRSVAILVFAAGWYVLAHLFVILYEEPNAAPKVRTNLRGLLPRGVSLDSCPCYETVRREALTHGSRP